MASQGRQQALDPEKALVPAVRLITQGIEPQQPALVVSHGSLDNVLATLVVSDSDHHLVSLDGKNSFEAHIPAEATVDKSAEYTVYVPGTPNPLLHSRRGCLSLPRWKRPVEMRLVYWTGSKAAFS